MKHGNKICSDIFKLKKTQKVKNRKLGFCLVVMMFEVEDVKCGGIEGLSF